MLNFSANPNAIARTYVNNFSYTPDGKIEKLRLGKYRWEWAKFNGRLQVTELNFGSDVDDTSLWKLKYESGELSADGTSIEAKNNRQENFFLIRLNNLSKSRKFFERRNSELVFVFRIVDYKIFNPRRKINEKIFTYLLPAVFTFLLSK